MKKLIKALEQVDFEDIGSVNRVLRGIRSDILYFNRIKKRYVVDDICNILTNYLSTNQYELYQNQENSYSRQKFYQELIRLNKMCNELSWG